MKMLFSRPDMRLPAAAALAWPDRLSLVGAEDLSVPPLASWALDFFEPDLERFPCLALARSAGERGGAYPPLLIGADEFAVRAFLKKMISFPAISHIIGETLERYSGPSPSTLGDAIELISEGRGIAEKIFLSMEDKK